MLDLWAGRQQSSCLEQVVSYPEMGVFVELHSGAILTRDAKGNEVIDCVGCGFAHLWSKPTGEELADYYSRSFYETHTPKDWAEKEAAEAFAAGPQE